MHERQQEVRQAMTEWRGAVYMIAFTSPHYRGDDLGGLRKRITGAWSKMLSGAPWKRLRARYGLKGYIRALEITWGNANGWHPHLHALFFLDRELTEAERETLEGALFDRWNAIGEREGAKPCKRSLFQLDRVATPEAAGDYVAKWGADHEITHLHAKRARGGGMTPWDLLDLADKGGARARRLFQTYAKATFRARHLTWSKGLKDAVGLLDRDDAELAAEAKGETVLVIDGQDADRLRKAGRIPRLLEVAEAGGAPAALAFIEAAGASIRTDDARRRRRQYFGESDAGDRDERAERADLGRAA
jgi:hypothetical protein